jgi:putative colanic acid biosynthesis UDP-glucose lipid carrier transferase
MIGIWAYVAIGYTNHAASDDLLIVAAASILGYHVAAELSRLYRSWRGSRLRWELGCVLLTWAYAAPALLGIGLITRYNAHFEYESKIVWLLGTPIVVGILRVIVSKLLQILRARDFNTRRFAICGVNELGIQLSRNILNAPELGLRLAGFYDDRPASRTTTLPKDVGRQVGDIKELVSRARRGDIEIVYITFPMRAERRIDNVLRKLADTTASVYIVPDFFVFELLHARWTNINGLPAVSVFESPLFGVDGLVKRATDFVLGGLMLAALAVPMLVIAAAVKWTSRGPVFFRQTRYGLDGRKIFVWKFRTMTCCENGAAVRQATSDDDRVTRVGRFLRRTSLDELPQLFNVLEGTMSLVGPRPHATAHNEQYRTLIGGYMLRHKVKPGITGLAQISGYRGETETVEKMVKRVECDHQYIRDWSLGLDLAILAKTPLAVFSQRNAH